MYTLMLRISCFLLLPFSHGLPDLVNPLPAATAGPDLGSHRDELEKIMDLLGSGELVRSPGNPTHVVAQVGINRIVSVTTEAIRVDIILCLAWFDNRLRHGSLIPLVASGVDKSSVWIPPVFFPDAVDITDFNMLKDNNFVRIFPDGHVHYEVRMVLENACAMDLHDYPFDKQLCRVQMGILGHSVQEVTLNWEREEAIIMHNAELVDTGVHADSLTTREYDIDRRRIVSDAYNVTIQTRRSNGGSDEGYRSVLSFDIPMERRLGYVKQMVFIPSMIFTFVAYTSFWLDPGSTPARTAVAVTSLLTLQTLITGIRRDIPKVSYATAIDQWMMVCEFAVFFSMAEFILVYQLSLCENADKSSNDRRIRAENSEGTFFRPQSTDSLPVRGKWTRKLPLAKTIDRVCRVLYPAVIIVFVVTFFPRYT